jgi:glycine/D-amino acid oxidase-like deaminating enzyme
MKDLSCGTNHAINQSEMPIAILGGGILGTCTALELADRGHRLTVFERNAEPLSEASLYNEGKLHLGFVYAADPSFRTAERMLRGAGQFMDILGRWIPHTALCALPTRPFDYVVHRDTMVAVPDIEAHFGRVRQRLEEVLPLRPVVSPLDVSRPVWRRLTGDELAERYDPVVIEAAYETCEIAVDPWAIAIHLRAALRAHPRIELIAHAAVNRAEDRPGGGFDVIFEAQGERRVGPFAAVVNALWANRPAVDHRYGLTPRAPWIIRRKLGVNLLCDRAPDGLASFTVMLGPFGDVVSYQSGRVYLSWYPACMIGTITGAQETDWNAVLRGADFNTVRRETIDALARICPAVGNVEAIAGRDAVVNGGSIFALGQTDIDDPGSQLHERLDTGVDGRGTYLSVDTAKFTLAPAVAVQTADRVTALVGAPVG